MYLSLEENEYLLQIKLSSRVIVMWQWLLLSYFDLFVFGFPYNWEFVQRDETSSVLRLAGQLAPFARELWLVDRPDEVSP